MSTHQGPFKKCEHSRSESRRKARKSRSQSPHEFLEQSPKWESSRHIPKDDLVIIGRGEVGLELNSEMRHNKQLRKTIREAVRKISNRISPNAVNAFIEHDREDPDQTRVVIEVSVDIDSVEEYQTVKASVREIVRAAERDDIMVYTRISY